MTAPPPLPPCYPFKCTLVSIVFGTLYPLNLFESTVKEKQAEIPVI
jgi:hypothetical protein